MGTLMRIIGASLMVGLACNTYATELRLIEVFVDNANRVTIHDASPVDVQIYHLDGFNQVIDEMNQALASGSVDQDRDDIQRLMNSYEYQLSLSSTVLSKANHYQLTHVPAWVVNEGEMIFYGTAGLDEVLILAEETME